MDTSFGIWDAGRSFSATSVTGPHVLSKKSGVPGFPMARPRVCKALIPVFCILMCLERGPNKNNYSCRINRVLEISTTGPTIFLGPDNPSDYDKLRCERIRNNTGPFLCIPLPPLSRVHSTRKSEATEGVNSVQAAAASLFKD